MAASMRTPLVEGALFWLNVRSTARRAWRRNNLQRTAGRRQNLDLGIDAGRRADDALGFIELFAEVLTGGAADGRWIAASHVRRTESLWRRRSVLGRNLLATFARLRKGIADRDHAADKADDESCVPQDILPPTKQRGARKNVPSAPGRVTKSLGISS